MYSSIFVVSIPAFKLQLSKCVGNMTACPMSIYFMPSLSRVKDQWKPNSLINKTQILSRLRWNGNRYYLIWGWLTRALCHDLFLSIVTYRGTSKQTMAFLGTFPANPVFVKGFLLGVTIFRGHCLLWKTPFSRVLLSGFSISKEQILLNIEDFSLSK